MDQNHFFQVEKFAKKSLVTYLKGSMSIIYHIQHTMVVVELRGSLI
jgi:uncharacterized protein YbcI